MANVRGRSALLVLAVAVLGGWSVGCGESGDTRDTEAVVESRIARERADAARVARQEERIKQLEREARKARTTKSDVRTVVVETPARPPAPATPQVDRASVGSDDWGGGAAQTVMLASMSTPDGARRIQQRATSAGLDAGVLFSSNYASLRPGYWVVFSGKFDTTTLASERQARARSLGFSDAYVRFVAP